MFCLAYCAFFFFKIDNPHPSVYLLAVQSPQIQSSNQLIASFPCEKFSMPPVLSCVISGIS